MHFYHYDAIKHLQVLVLLCKVYSCGSAEKGILLAAKGLNYDKTLVYVVKSKRYYSALKIRPDYNSGKLYAHKLLSSQPTPLQKFHFHLINNSDWHYRNQECNVAVSQWK